MCIIKGQGCTAVGVYIHELLHTLGFYHHHSRSDRDDYLGNFYFFYQWFNHWDDD